MIIKNNWVLKIKKAEKRNKHKELIEIFNTVKNSILNNPRNHIIEQVKIIYHDDNKEIEEALNKEFTGLIFKVEDSLYLVEYRTINVNWKLN